MKWSARWEQLHICSGLSSNCTSAIASMTDTFIRCSRNFSWPTFLHSFVLFGNFSRMCLNVPGQYSIVLSAAIIDRGTTLNSYVPTASFTSISGWLLQITIIRASRFLSFCIFTVSPVHGTLIFLVMDFQVWSFCFFMVDHRLILPDWIRSLTNVSKKFLTMSLCLTRSSWTLSGTTTFVTRLKSLLLSWLKGFVKLSMVFKSFSMHFD